MEENEFWGDDICENCGEQFVVNLPCDIHDHAEPTCMEGCDECIEAQTDEY